MISKNVNQNQTINSLCSMKFCVKTWHEMSQKTKSRLTETAQNLFHLMEQFPKLKRNQYMNILI